MAISYCNTQKIIEYESSFLSYKLKDIKLTLTKLMYADVKYMKLISIKNNKMQYFILPEEHKDK